MLKPISDFSNAAACLFKLIEEITIMLVMNSVGIFICLNNTLDNQINYYVYNESRSYPLKRQKLQQTTF